MDQLARGLSIYTNSAAKADVCRMCMCMCVRVRVHVRVHVRDFRPSVWSRGMGGCNSGSGSDLPRVFDLILVGVPCQLLLRPSPVPKADWVVSWAAQWIPAPPMVGFTSCARACVCACACACACARVCTRMCVRACGYACGCTRVHVCAPLPRDTGCVRLTGERVFPPPCWFTGWCVSLGEFIVSLPCWHAGAHSVVAEFGPKFSILQICLQPTVFVVGKRTELAFNF